MTESPAIEPDDFRFRLLCDMWSHESDLIDAGSDVGLHGGACGQFCGFEVFDTCDGGQGHQRTCDGEFDKFVVVLGDSRAEYWKPIVALCLYYRLRQYIGFDSYFLFRLRPKSGRTSPGRTSASRLAVRPAASSSHATAAMAALSVQSSGGAMNSSMRSLRHMVLSAVGMDHLQRLPHAQAGVLQQSDCLAAFFDHDFDRGSLESGGEVGDQFRWCAGELIWSGDSAGCVEHGGFESGEAEVQFSGVQQRARHAESVGVSGGGSLLNGGATGVGQSKNPGGLVEGFSGGVIGGTADQSAV